MHELERLLEAGRTHEAKSAAERLVAQRPQERSALVVLCKVALLEGQLDQARQYLERAERGGGASEETWLLRANLAAQRGELPEAEKSFRQVIGLAAQRAEAHFGLGLVLFKQGQTDGALEALKAAVRLQPQNAVFVYRLGQVQLEANAGEVGLKMLARAISLQPTFLPPYLSLIEALVEQGRPVEARRVVAEGLEALPQHPRLLSVLTALSLGMGDAKTSYLAASAVAAQRPRDPDAQVNLGLLLLLRGQPDAALHLCRTMESLGLATVDLKLLEALVHESAEPPAYDAAEAAYEEAMGLEPEGWKAPNNLGQLLLRRPSDTLGDEYLPRALTVLEEAVRRAPDRAEPHLNLALARARTGDEAGARAQAQAVLAAQPPARDDVREQAERLLSVLGPKEGLT